MLAPVDRPAFALRRLWSCGSKSAERAGEATAPSAAERATAMLVRLIAVVLLHPCAAEHDRGMLNIVELPEPDPPFPRALLHDCIGCVLGQAIGARWPRMQSPTRSGYWRDPADQSRSSRNRQRRSCPLASTSARRPDVCRRCRRRAPPARPRRNRDGGRCDRCRWFRAGRSGRRRDDSAALARSSCRRFRASRLAEGQSSLRELPRRRWRKPLKLPTCQ